MLAEFSTGNRRIESSSLIATQRFYWLMGHYPMRVFISNTAYLDVGRGSMTAAMKVSSFTEDRTGCVATIGQFCDFADSCTLEAGDDHRNELPVNVGFTSAISLRHSAYTHNISSLKSISRGPITIGNAVVVSSRAAILAGTSIGDGAVIAAGAIVRHDVPEFCVYGGVPAKHLKSRFDDVTKEAIMHVAWWDFETCYLGQNLDRLQELAVDTEAKHHYQPPMPRFVIKLLRRGNGMFDISVIAYLDGEKMIPIEKAPKRVFDYVNQLASSDGPMDWVANIWETP